MTSLRFGSFIYKIKGMQESHSWRRGRDSEYASHSPWCCCQSAKAEEESGQVENKEQRRERDRGEEREGEGHEKRLLKAGGHHQ